MTEHKHSKVCCGMRNWVKTIAWLQIVLNGISVLVFAFILLGLVLMNRTEESKSEQLYFEDVDFDLSAVIIQCLLLLADCIISTAFGVLLLVGVKKNRSLYLKLWMSYLTFCWTFSFIAAIKDSPETRTFLLISLIPYGLAVYVVCLLVIDIENNHQGQCQNILNVVHESKLEAVKRDNEERFYPAYEMQNLPPSYDSLFVSEEV